MDETSQDQGRRTATRTVLAGCEPTTCKALRDLATVGLGMDVVGETDDALTLRATVSALRPDLVIVAWTLTPADACSLLRSLRAARPRPRVVALGLRPDARREALAAGADAYVSMVDPPDVVARVLRAQAGDPSHKTATRRRPA